VLINPKQAIRARVNSSNYEDRQTVKWRRPKVGWSDLDLIVEQDNWALIVEGKDIEWEKAKSLDSAWDCYRLYLDRCSRGQQRLFSSLACMGIWTAICFHHTRLRPGFSGPTYEYRDGKKLFIAATGPIRAQESEMAHPYVHTPLIIAIQAPSKVLRDIAATFLRENLPSCCLVFADERPTNQMAFVKLPTPVGDLAIEDIDNDAYATIATANLNTYLAQEYRQLFPSKLIEKFDCF
jgi:hypothetical protein